METKAAQTRNAEIITISRAEYETLKAENAELTRKLDWLMEQLHLSRQKRFGSSSEKTDEDGFEQLSLLFNEVEVCAQQEKAEPGKEEPVAVAAHVRKRKSGSVRDILAKNIPVETIEHGLSEEERSCPRCGEVMEEIGTQVRETLKFIPAKVILQRDVYYTYACRNCGKGDISTPVVKTPKEPALLPGSFASPEAVAYIATQKYVMGSPLYRLEQDLKRQGVELKRQTMSNWLMRCEEDWLEPVYDLLHQQLVLYEVLHADETTLQVLHELGKKAQTKSYMWLYRTSREAEHPIVLYEYQPDRKKEHPKEFLAGFRGYLHTDGYAGYHDLPESITGVGCWAHARRYFDEAVKSLPKGKRSGSSAATGLAYCTKLFQEEKKLAELPPEERYKKRLELEKPVLDALFAWAQTRCAAPKSALGKALHYLQEQRPYLLAYLKDGRLELSNNRAERSIKPFVIDRKNFLFANTPDGAQCSAVIFSLIETAKENHLDPYRYLCYVLKTAPSLAQTQPDWAIPLLPANAPNDCRIPEHIY